MTRFERALGILLLLRSGRRLPASDLARRFEVSTRTIYRDVDVLGQLGVPVIAETGRKGGFRLQEGFFLPPVMFSLGEAISLLLGAGMLRGLTARPFAADLETGEEKLVAAMPERLRAVLAEARSIIGFERVAGDAFHAPQASPDGAVYERDVAAEGRIVETFLQAVLNRRTVSLRYRSPYNVNESEQIVSPLGVFCDRDLWYLVGRRWGESGEPRLWRADRVRELLLQTRSAAPDPTFDVRRLLDRAWLDAAMADWTRGARVAILLTPEQAERLRRDWYYGHAAFAPDGEGRCRMTFGECDRWVVLELLRWLGPGAELIEPVEWRASLRDELIAMASTYDGAGNSDGGIRSRRADDPYPAAPVERQR
jgi:predicted DNA-binding transcriptional regulator YafY